MNVRARVLHLVHACHARASSNFLGACVARKGCRHLHTQRARATGSRQYDACTWTRDTRMHMETVMLRVLAKNAHPYTRVRMKTRDGTKLKVCVTTCHDNNKLQRPPLMPYTSRRAITSGSPTLPSQGPPGSCGSPALPSQGDSRHKARRCSLTRAPVTLPAAGDHPPSGSAGDHPPSGPHPRS